MQSHWRIKSRSLSMRWYRLSAIGIVLFLAQCSTTRNIDWQFVVPDKYQGFLVIRYACPNGRPLVINDNHIEVEFNQEGIFCASDAFFPTRGQQFVRSTSGHPIPVAIEPQATTGYAFYAISTRTIGGDTQQNPGPADIILSISWVGNMEDAPAMTGTKKYDVDVFLEDRFDIPKFRE
jgi:hypothetical protein